MLGFKPQKNEKNKPKGHMRYTPFDKELNDFSTSELANLREVAEGWYVEYKSQPPVIKDIAKSLSSFANQYGGWLFLGVEEDSETNTAESFPGIEGSKVPEVLEAIRNAAKDVVRPQVFYQTRTIEGPLKAIGLNPGRSIIIVRVPEGADTPYIHNDGRIYIRVGDSSSPTPVREKATFDLLYRRGEDKQSFLESLVERTPELSKGEGERSYIHLTILSDPYETLGHWYGGSFADFCDLMKGKSIPFENIYTAPDGFIARQIESNDPFNRLLTWEFSRNCNSFITIPLSTLSSEVAIEALRSKSVELWAPYASGPEFVSALNAIGLRTAKILNLNLLLTLLGVIMSRHRRIVGQSGVRGPFYIKARIENVWRAVPFLDLDNYLKHIREFGFPVVQESELIVPRGRSLESFEVSPEHDCPQSEPMEIGSSGSVGIWLEVMMALGIPGEVLAQDPTELLSISNKEAEIQRARRSTEAGETPHRNSID